MTNEEAIEYWEGLRKTFSSQLEKEENHFGRMHLQTTIDAIDMAISAIRQQEHFRDLTKKVEPLTNAQKIRAMSDKELAKIIEHELGCPVTGNCEKMSRDCKACWLDWLQQPAEEDKHEDD